MDNFSFKFLKDFNTPPKASRVCSLSSLSSLSSFTPFNANNGAGFRAQKVQPGYAFGATWLCFWCNLAMLLVQPGYAFGATWLCFWCNLAMLLEFRKWMI
jgi:hypothetical protein